MNTHLLLELIGYAASVLIAISLMMRSLLRLRLINLAGAAAFSIYGLFIRAYPVAILNGLIVLVNLYHLAGMLRAKRYFRLLELRPQSDYLRYFLSFYADEIRSVLPNFVYHPADKQITLFILRDCVPVGVFIAHETAPGTLRVQLDFVVPPYRDLKIGKFLFVEQAEFFKERGIREIVIEPRTEKFSAYLTQVGFEPAVRKGETDASALRIAYLET